MEEEDPNRLLQTYVDLTYSRLDAQKTLQSQDVEIDLKTGYWTQTDQIIDSYIDQWLLEQSKYHISILGDFGTGKTSFCRHYTYKLMQRCKDDPTTRIPLLIPLKYFSELGRERSVRAIVTDYLVNEYKVTTNYETLERPIKAGKILFLLDGYDEMAMKVDTSTRKNNFDTLAELANIPNNMVLLTGRPGYFPTLTEIAQTFGHEPPPSDVYEQMDKLLESKISGELPVYEIVQLNPFSPKQIDSFLQKQSERLKQEGVSDWNTLKQTIQSMPELQELSTRPVLLWMMVEGLPILLKEIKEVRDINLARVYQSFTNKWLIRDWDKGEVRRLVSTQERRDFMKALACEMHRTTGKHEIHHNDLKEKIRQWKGFKIEREIVIAQPTP